MLSAKPTSFQQLELHRVLYETVYSLRHLCSCIRQECRTITKTAVPISTDLASEQQACRMLLIYFNYAQDPEVAVGAGLEAVGASLPGPPQQDWQLMQAAYL